MVVYIYIQRNELRVMREMKIALQVGAPEPDQLTAFMQAYTEMDVTAALSTADMIAAYDSGQLVGIGSRLHSPGQQSELKVYIAPGYERRGIRDHMAKLLLPKSERLTTAG
jgi:hypothetical protein